ncbi:MAG: MFS transporter [Rhodothermales bacterium]|nr:MFS transporter [Rhodothermales bacterium]
MTDRTIRPGALLGVLFLGVLMAALFLAVVGPALPAVGETFGVSERGLAWVFNVFVLCNLVGLPLMAKLSDVFGRRTVYVFDVLLFGMGALLAGLAPSFEVLLAGCGVQGLAASGIFPVASAVVGDVFPAERRGRALGVLGAVYGIAFIVGPLLASVLLPYGWSWLFLLDVPLAAAVAVAGWRMLPASRPAGARALDWRGILVLGVALGALTYGFNRIEADAFFASVASPAVWPFVVGALVLVPVFVWVERRAADPVLRLGLLKNGQVVRAGLLAFGAGLAEAAFVFLPLLAVAAFGVPKSVASRMLLPLTVAVFIGSPLAGRLLDRVGVRAIALGGSLLLAAGMAVVGLGPPTRAVFYAGTVLIGLGLAALLGSAISYILLNESRIEERTVAQGISTLFISIGQLLGAALIGALAASEADPLAGYQDAFVMIAVVAFALVVLSAGLRSRARAARAPSA